MIKRMISKLRLPRYVEFIMGVLLVIVLISRYSTGREAQNKYVLEYILPYRSLFILVTIFLFLVATRLIAGPPKNYTRFFYNVLLKLRSNRFLLILSLLFIVSCKDKPDSVNKRPFSQAEAGIQSMVDSFKVEYSDATSDILKDSIIDRYNRKLFDFLSSNHIDSIPVHVDTVINQGPSIMTKFHSNKDLAFQYTMNFKRKMNKQWDSIYTFMNNLKVGSDTTIGFVYMGSHQLSDPGDKTQPTLKIFAFPVPRHHR